MEYYVNGTCEQILVMDVVDFDKDLLNIAKNFLLLVTGELDKYTKEKGIVEAQENSVILFSPSHIQFARYGRGPGKKPPFDSILEWVKKENIKFDNTDERGTAFAIQASIGKNGTKNFVPNAPNFLEEELKKGFETMSDEMAAFLKVSFTQSIKEITETIVLETKFKI